MWIKRDISNLIGLDHSPVQIIRGPRQCGKSSLVLNLDEGFLEVSLDDLALRELAQTDPELFLKQFGDSKLFIDEAQYAPNLFPALKRRADLYKRKTSGSLRAILRLTGSNQILMDRNIKESLAGRASFFDMNTLSVAEILPAKNCSIQDILFQGGWPDLYARDDISAKKYLDDYIGSYIEKDIVLAAGIQKSNEFLKFARLLAGRVGELLDFANLSRDVGVDAKTIKGWVSVLEQMHIIQLVPPFFSNLSSRLIKSPKIYFIDTGLACRLQGWSEAQPIMTSPQQGHLFECLVFSEIYKTILNFGLSWQVFHWRSRDGEEVDFIIQKSPGDFLLIEAKVTSQKPPALDQFREIKNVFGNKIPQVITCHQEGERVLANQVPIGLLGKFLTA